MHTYQWGYGNGKFSSWIAINQKLSSSDYPNPWFQGLKVQRSFYYIFFFFFLRFSPRVNEVQMSLKMVLVPDHRCRRWQVVVEVGQTRKRSYKKNLEQNGNIHIFWSYPYINKHKNLIKGTQLFRFGWPRLTNGSKLVIVSCRIKKRPRSRRSWKTQQIEISANNY